ncbi:hypothetical protein KEJ39_00875 [Candidatus Bathyarchaeota archaeon]|nr:hypothetical protein [Candidatus Bathyarchaeota archaeon]
MKLMHLAVARLRSVKPNIVRCLTRKTPAWRVASIPSWNMPVLPIDLYSPL